MLAEHFDQSLKRLPFLNRWYFRRGAKIKRGYCLLMGKLGLLRPFSFVEWLVTYRCNFACSYCEASAGKPAPNELTTREGKGLIDDLKRAGVKRLLFSGGEPLARPDIVELMTYAHGRQLALGLVTNGYFVEAMWPDLKPLRYFLYFTSIDGLEAYHDRVRLAGSFARAMKGLELFKSIGVATRMVNTVMHPGNIDQLQELLKTLRGSAANVWHLTPVASVGRAAQKGTFGLDGKQLRHLVGFIKKNEKVMKIGLGESRAYLACFSADILEKPFFCGAGLTRCNIMPDGEVLGCQQVYDTAFSEGNIRNKPFSRIWKENFKRFREEKILTEDCKTCIHLDACQGGCWAEMQKQRSCLKEAYERAD